MILSYTKDICGNDLLTDENENQIMMEWEKAYMEACIDYLDISGSVLEVGFGLGYSARRICSSPNITEYNVIECSPVVWERFEKFRNEFPHIKMNLIKGRWEDVLCLCNKYDRCFFDDYISSINNKNRFSRFFYHFIQHHANMYCKTGCYSTTLGKFNLSGINTTSEEYKIDIPSHCRYTQGNSMFIVCFEKVGKLNETELKKWKESFNKKTMVGKLPSVPIFKAVSRGYGKIKLTTS